MDLVRYSIEKKGRRLQGLAHCVLLDLSSSRSFMMRWLPISNASRPVRHSRTECLRTAFSVCMKVNRFGHRLSNFFEAEIEGDVRMFPIIWRPAEVSRKTEYWLGWCEMLVPSND